MSQGKAADVVENDADDQESMEEGNAADDDESEFYVNAPPPDDVDPVWQNRLTVMVFLEKLVALSKSGYLGNSTSVSQQRIAQNAWQWIEDSFAADDEQPCNQTATGAEAPQIPIPAPAKLGEWGGSAVAPLKQVASSAWTNPVRPGDVWEPQ